MALKCGIIGLTNVGKTTLFNCMSQTRAQASNFAFSTNKSNLGTAIVPDPRLDKLHEMVKGAQKINATMELVDIPGLAKGASQGEGIGNAFLGDVRNCDALIHVLRCFDDPNLTHIEGSIDPVRDRDLIDFELQLKDLEQIEKKIQKTEKQASHGDKVAKLQLDSLIKFRTHLQDFQNIRTLELNTEDQKSVAELCLLTAIPVMYVCNVDDSSAVDGNAYSRKFVEQAGSEEVQVIAARAESDIAELETEEDQLTFLSDMGLTEPGVNKLIRAAYRLLNLISFFTVGGKEDRAWTLRKGLTAPEAAGVIHSDLQRGFIRAEVIHYADFVEYGTEAACRDKGKLNVEGKTYIIHDGDILNIRFNV